MGKRTDQVQATVRCPNRCQGGRVVLTINQTWDDERFCLVGECIEDVPAATCGCQFHPRANPQDYARLLVSYDQETRG